MLRPCDPGRDAVRCVLAGLPDGLVGLLGDPGSDLGVVFGLLRQAERFGLGLTRALGRGVGLAHQAGHRIPTESGHDVGDRPAGVDGFPPRDRGGRSDGVGGG